jgi:hypothetical protein
LLARTYLYTKNWTGADSAASAVISKYNLFSLVPDLNGVFLKNSKETILQFQVYGDDFPYATWEAFNVIPSSHTSNPKWYASDKLLNAFEPNDKRKVAWLDTTNYQGTKYFYPFKYKIRFGVYGSVTEYYMALRLAEQYLIRAEARLKLSNLTGSIADINVIRNRASLSSLPTTLTEAQVSAAISQERMVEFFAEWGNRWLDLNRTGESTNILAPLKPQWTDNAKLYPIPQSEIDVDPRLKQNTGY